MGLINFKDNVKDMLSEMAADIEVTPDLYSNTTDIKANEGKEGTTIRYNTPCLFALHTVKNGFDTEFCELSDKEKAHETAEFGKEVVAEVVNTLSLNAMIKVSDRIDIEQLLIALHLAELQLCTRYNISEGAFKYLTEAYDTQYGRNKK